MSTFERRFRLSSVPDLELTQSVKIHQVYWRIGNDWSIRIRQEILPSDSNYTITIKGPRSGVDRPEIKTVMFSGVPDKEREEQLTVLSSFLNSGAQNSIDKTRHYADIDGYIWEIDVFEGKADGLIIAEVHCSDRDFLKDIEPPREWESLNLLEVTSDSTYNNENLAYDTCTWVKE